MQGMVSRCWDDKGRNQPSRGYNCSNGNDILSACKIQYSAESLFEHLQLLRPAST